MATLGGNVLTLLDAAKRTDPDGSVTKIAEMLMISTPLIGDMSFIEGNLITGNRSTSRTSLPTVAWRQINQGTQPSKSTTAQSDDHAAFLDAWSEVDEKLANLGGNPAAVRLSEASAFIEAMGQEAESTLIYGNAGTAPEEFTGIMPRYNSLAAANGQNIVDAGGTGSDNTSILLVTWGEQAATGIYPKGSKAGLQHEDLGVVTVETTAGIAGNRMRAYQDHFTWDLGLTIKDWRSVVRIANIDVSNLVAASSAASIINVLTRATYRPPGPGGRRVIYMNRTVAQALDLQLQTNVAAGGGLTYQNVEGQQLMSFRGIPIKLCDSLLETEARVT